MSARMKRGDQFLLLLLAAMVGAWGLLGAADVAKRTHAGFAIDGDFVITQISPGGPAERVRMQVGDRITRIDGIDAADTGNILRLPRVAAGERRSYTVTRGEQTIRYRPAFQPLDADVVAREYLSTVVGFAFLLIPLAACLTRPNAATRVLALMGLGASLAFFDGPYVASYDLRAVATVVAELFMLLGIAAAVHFLLVFPQTRPSIQKGWGKKLVYLPMLSFWALIAWRVLLTPPTSSIAVFTSQFISGLGITSYFLIGLFLLLRNYSRTDRQERRRLALNRMLWATVAAIIPTVVAKLVTLVSPHTPLPGQDEYFAFVALIPIAWSLSAARS